MKQPILTAENLTIGYVHKKAQKVILSNLNFSLYQGEVVGLLGANGVGKSTLLRTLSGVQPELAGTISIEGKPLSSFSKNELAQKLSLVLTDSIRQSQLTVYDLVALGRIPYTNWTGHLSPNDHQKVAEAIALTHIQYIQEANLDELSDGQLQKAMIARALAQDGEIMILDEPIAHLDIPNKLDIMKLLQNLARTTQKAIIIATHELELALQMSDKLWLLECDSQLTVGLPEELALKGEISKIYGTHAAHFDISQGVFKLHTEIKHHIHVKGNSAETYWTSRALEKLGIGLKDQAENSLSWHDDRLTLKWQGNENTFNSLGEVVAFLTLDQNEKTSSN
ncbi:ABC transporter ATP-binding protein [Penaeicola halotolerans]|uniref:ABC transporter ATP-binding protein n=1 Tax=Penaeicola halotolerans TaxID=2793196 RepID=UPI001CF92288|nr:ABC transporter ATP-binding protein [Penaeicola halotolerans]